MVITNVYYITMTCNEYNDLSIWIQAGANITFWDYRFQNYFILITGVWEHLWKKKSEIIWNAWKDVFSNALKVWKLDIVKSKKPIYMYAVNACTGKILWWVWWVWIADYSVYYRVVMKYVDRGAQIDHPLSCNGEEMSWRCSKQSSAIRRKLLLCLTKCWFVYMNSQLKDKYIVRKALQTDNVGSKSPWTWWNRCIGLNAFSTRIIIRWSRQVRHLPGWNVK